MDLSTSSLHLLSLNVELDNFILELSGLGVGENSKNNIRMCSVKIVVLMKTRISGAQADMVIDELILTDHIGWRLKASLVKSGLCGKRESE